MKDHRRLSASPTGDSGDFNSRKVTMEAMVSPNAIPVAEFSDDIDVHITLAPQTVSEIVTDEQGMQPPILEWLARFVVHVRAYEIVAEGREQRALRTHKRRRSIEVVLNKHDAKRPAIEGDIP